MPLLFALLCLPWPLLAQGPEIDWGSWGLSSVLVVGLVLALGWLLRKTRFGNGLGGHRQLRVVATLALGSRERLLVVQVGEEQWLLGVTAQQVSSLGKLERPLSLPSSHDATKTHDKS